MCEILHCNRITSELPRWRSSELVRALNLALSEVGCVDEATVRISETSVSFQSDFRYQNTGARHGCTSVLGGLEENSG